MKTPAPSLSGRDEFHLVPIVVPRNRPEWDGVEPVPTRKRRPRFGRDDFHVVPIVFFLLLCLSLLASPAPAQDFTVDWFSIDGGGGVSSNSQYQITGTIGQPDAGGPLSAGPYSVTGGFWSLLQVVPTPGAPPLRIFLTATNTALLAWPAAPAGFTLQ